jgi:aminoglycoside phosphotransferase (APT) family kinase protein
MAADDPPGPLVGAGRSADIFALGTDRVVRRFRRGYDARSEADLMVYLTEAGFPVPAVYDASGPDIVMERLDGRDMLADFGRRPWLARSHGRLLAGLHNRLHQIPAPAWLRPSFEPGDRVLHLDLHPANVMLTSRGPVVIDWSNAAAGPAAADIAMAYVIVASSEVDLVPLPLRLAVGPLRSAHLAQFVAACDDDPWPAVGSAVKSRLTDPNVRPSEAQKLRQIAERAGSRSRR